MEQLADELIGGWPDPIPTCHRRFFGDGRIILDLHFKDSTSAINDLSGTIDAWCLDGFALKNQRSGNLHCSMQLRKNHIKKLHLVRLLLLAGA